MLKLPYVFIQVVQLFQRAAKATSFINPRWATTPQNHAEESDGKSMARWGGWGASEVIQFVWDQNEENNIHDMYAYRHIYSMRCFIRLITYIYKVHLRDEEWDTTTWPWNHYH